MLTRFHLQELRQIIAILTASLSGVSLGLLFAWTSPAIPQIIENESYNITLEEASYFTVICSASIGISSPIFSKLLDLIGRRVGVLSVVVPQLLSWLLVIFAEEVWLFYISRFMAGLADAAVFCATPIYVCEISEPKIRDVWGNVMSLGIILGAFLMNVIGAYNSVKASAVICGCIPLLHFGLFWFMPESPYYLIMKGREEDARKTLATLRARSDVDEELLEIKDSVHRQMAEKSSFSEVFTIGTNLRALFICVLARFAQYFSGLPAFQTYTQYLFQQTGGNISEKVSAMIFSGSVLLCTLICLYIIGRFGKRPLMISSTFGCGLILATLSGFLCVKQFTSINLSHLDWLPLAGLLLYVFVGSLGLTTLPTLLLGEMFPTNVKSKAISVVNIALSVFELIVPKMFQLLITHFGIYAPFLMFTCCCFISGILLYVYMIETKGKSLEEIQQALRKQNEGTIHTPEIYRVKEM